MSSWIVALIMAGILTLGYCAPASAVVVNVRPVTVPVTNSEAHEWAEFHDMAYAEYSQEFIALFNSYETRWSKNGRLMIRDGSSGPYKFARKG